MKAYHLLLALPLILLSGCGALWQGSAEKSAEQQRIAESVNHQLNERHFKVEITYMMPLRGGGAPVDGSYSITVDGNDINSHLPYFGAAYNVPYGGGKGLTFQDDIDAYSDSGWQKDKRTIVLTTNNGEDTLVYTLTVFDDAGVDVRVHSRNRDDIGYRGNLITEDDD